MSKLMVSVSGIRGIVGETFTPDVIIGFTHAFVKIVGKGTVYVGRDPRGSGEMVEDLVVGTLLSIGCKVIKLGIVPTPTVEIMVANHDSAGGIIITASHNPPQWNALKFINKQGMFLEKPLVNELSQYFDSGTRIPPVAWEQVFVSHFDNTAVTFHKNRILSLPFIDVPALQKRRFKVVLDCNHGVAAVMGRSFLQDLGCDVVTLGEAPDGKFEHPCEPIPENLGALCQSVVREKADIGFAIDPDGDRVAIVSEQGKAIGEEYTLAIGTQCILSRKKGPITLNLSTSRMAEDVAKSYGCQCFRTAVGEINVSSEMKRNGSVVGGEGNGGVMIPEVQCCRDAFGGMALCLQFLVDRKESISTAMTSLPAFIMRKETVPLGTMNADELLEKVLAKFSDATVDKQDGLHFSWPDSWIHVRKSNTEPILRIIAEGKTKERITELIASVRGLIPGDKK
jgi:phosphomannomutase